jgi:uncharacterized phage-associated protein
MTDSKLLAFEYVVYHLLRWHKRRSATGKNDLSILKTLKLLFFVTAARSNKNETSFLLDKVFSNFVAMPYGHVESDIYNGIISNSGVLNYFSIDNKCTNEINISNTANIEYEISLTDEFKKEVRLSIEYLSQQSPNLILLSPFELVNLSHTWYSWQKFFKEAKKSSQRSIPIPADCIKSEYKLYSI